MPRHAVDANGQLIHAEALSTDSPKSVFCRRCENELILAGGTNTRVAKHFRHRPGETCIDYDEREETELHLERKVEIANFLESESWVSGVEMEQDLETTRPDVLFTTDGTDFAVEIQVSGISADEIYRRTKERSKNDIHTLWLFHPETYKATTVSDNGNEYVQFKAGELGYLSLFDEPPSWMLYCAPDHDDRLGTAIHVDLFEEANGGWPGRNQAVRNPVPFTTTNGLRLATIEEAVPETTGDENQARLF